MIDEKVKIVLLGCGNVGFHLGQALNALPQVELMQVFSRTRQKAQALAQLLDCKFATQINRVNPKADLYILAVHDSAIGLVARELAQHITGDALVVHTSGATPSDVLRKHFPHFGIFYPLQSFSIDKKPDFPSIPFCLDAHSEEAFLLLEDLAGSISTQVARIDDRQRAILHVAAVFVNNFTNYLYTVGADICAKENVPFDLLKPLINETAAKIQNKSPLSMQTGPAARGDASTLKRHSDFLKAKTDYQALYKMLTERIVELYRKNG